MDVLVSRQGIIDALSEFLERGDDRWAGMDDLPSQESIGRMVAESLDGQAVLTDDDLGGLSEEEMQSLIDGI